MDESFIEWIQEGKNIQNKWHNYIEDRPELKEKSQTAEKIILAMTLPEERIDRIEGIKARIQDQIEKVETKNGLGIYFDDSDRHTKAKDKIWFFSRIAATIAIIISLSTLLYYTPNNLLSIDDQSEYESKSTLNGQKLTVHLSDGTKVRLNANSTIRYKKYFDDNSRVIELEGEAFFDVAKDPNRPFMVYSGDYLTTAIGTEFNVKENEGIAKVALLSGLVSVEGLKETGEKNYLTPGKMVIYSEESTSVTTFDYDEIIGWKDDILFFKNTERDEVFKVLEKWYGKTFKIDPSFYESTPWKYTGKFINESLFNVLTSIGYAENFDFEINDKEIVIKPRSNEKMKEPIK